MRGVRIVAAVGLGSALLRSVWYRLRIRRRERRFRQDRIARAISRRHGWRVLDGPFAGLLYARQAVGSVLVPKLLGCYEAELHDVIAHIIRTEYASIVNAGCAEGYYAVGLAVRLPAARVYAFDTSRVARKLCQAMASANGVAERVHVDGRCDTNQLRALPLDGALLVCDVEGHELDLLRPEQVPGLARCDVLVELHDFKSPHVTSTVLSRFQGTHEIVLISSAPRDPAEYEPLRSFRPTDQRLAIDEGRPAPQLWAFMTAKDAPNG